MKPTIFPQIGRETSSKLKIGSVSQVMQDTTLHIGPVQSPTIEREPLHVLFQLFPCFEVLNVFHILEVLVKVAEDYIIACTIGI